MPQPLAPPAQAADFLTLGTLGAIPQPGGTRFLVVAPAARNVRLHLEGGPALRLEPLADGVFGRFVGAVAPGARYRLQLDDGPMMPDPASRFQPDGVHGPSEVVDPGFSWTDQAWRGPDAHALRIYELHVGTFTPEGTFEAAAAKLVSLAELGVNAVELMPVADFAGNRNWGYDPASLFAPARCYGRPDDLRRLVDDAHQLGLAVLLDVVYNHLGPDGAYLPAFIPSFFSDTHHGPWGKAVNLDGPGSQWVRWLIGQNARYWIRDFHLDGLRLDATHTLLDGGPTHLLRALADVVHAEGAAAARRTVVIAEDERNWDRLVRAPGEGGFGLDGVWADDFHHQVRSATAGDNDGYYGDYTGSAADIAATAARGWFYTGQHSAHSGKPRGTEACGLPPERFVFCIQNHDQVGNRAFGERLNQQVDVPTFLAASLLLLALPETPLLFMGQEWAAATPFLFFTDHGTELGRLVTEGRRREFQSFAAFADPAAREAIPDPQAVHTFEASRLRWEEAEREPHAGVRRFYQAMLRLRACHPLLQSSAPMRVEAIGEAGVAVWRQAEPGSEAAGRLAALVCLRGSLRADLPAAASASTLLSTEDASYQLDTRPIRVHDQESGRAEVHFERPGGILLELA